MVQVPALTVSGAAPAQSPGRTLLSYLVVPRPKDLVKAFVAPLVFAVGAAAQGGVSSSQMGRALLVWLALELLVYPARYQWNDVRGFAADQAHPDAASRGRLPGPPERGRRHQGASVAVAALRMLLVLGLALAVPAVAGVVLAMTVGVFAVAAVYETLRSAATGRSDQVPVPLRPALVGLWVVVGAGYAVRGLTGLGLAVDLADRPGLVVASVVTMWALGVVFVTCRWALESMCFARFRDGRVHWEVGSGKAREHTVGLVRWLPTQAPRDAGVSPSRWQPLHGRTSPVAPWNLALVVAGGGAGLSGHLLSGGGGSPVALVAVAVGAATATVVSQLPRVRGLCALAGALLLLGLELVAGQDRAPVAVLPLLIVFTAHRCFARQRADEVGHPLRHLQRLLPG